MSKERNNSSLWRDRISIIFEISEGCRFQEHGPRPASGGRTIAPLSPSRRVASPVCHALSPHAVALKKSTDQTDSALLVGFLLRMILDAVSSAAPQVTPQVTPQVARLLNVLVGEMSREELQSALDLQDRKSFRELYIQSALTGQLIEMTIPEKPNSRLQRYRLTDAGRRWLRV